MRRLRVVQNPHEARIDGPISPSGPLTIPFTRFSDEQHSGSSATASHSTHTSKVPSLVVATLRPLFRVARFNADRTFFWLSVSCASGTFSATPFGA